MKAREVRERSNDELVVELNNLRESLFRLRFKQVTENTHYQNEIRGLRRDIARVLTVMQERQSAGKKG